MDALDAAPAEAAVSPLRDAVLAGRIIGPKAGDTAGRLAGLIAGSGLPETIVSWFGAERACALVQTPDQLRGALDRDIAAIDDLIGAQLDAILHHQRFSAMEGRWRGLDWLLHSFDASGRIKVRLFSLTWVELARDLDRAVEFDQSRLFQRIYEDEFGMPGGEPFGLIVIDHDVHHLAGPGGDNVSTLKLLSAVAAAAFVPMVLPASPRLLEVDDFADLAFSLQPASPLRAPSHARWRSLRGIEDMRFICVALPRVLARPTWRDDPARYDGFRYVEYAPDSATRCWMSAGFAFASCVARAFAAFSWPADVRGVVMDREAGGVVLDLPGETDAIGSWMRSSLELVLTDTQERDLIDAGLLPICSLPFSEEATFSAVRSLQEPARLTSELASANAQISAQINSMLCVGRFAHYIKVMGRDMVGSTTTADVVERRLQKWLDPYVNGNVIGSRDSRARAPLTAGRVTVTERADKPGVFGCVVHLQPHFQLDDVSTTFRLVTALTVPGGRPTA